jgi:hypothetical protein
MSSDKLFRAEDVREMVNKLEISDDDRKGLFNLVSYEGADPVIIFNKIFRLSKTDASIPRHVNTLIAVGLYRGFGAGKTLEKILSKSRASAVDPIQLACTKLKVVFGKAKKNTDVTIGRLMAAFPTQTYHQWLAAPNQRFPHDGISVAFQFTGAPAIMSEDLWASEREDWADWAVKLHSLWGQEPDRESILRFADMQNRSRLCLPEDRVTEDPFDDDE